jgi:hypothetical protein
MPSSGEVGRGVTTDLDDGCAATGFATAGLTEAALGAAGVFGAGFSGLAVLMVGVTIGFSAFVSCGVMGLGAGGRGAALTTHTPRTT